MTKQNLITQILLESCTISFKNYFPPIKSMDVLNRCHPMLRMYALTVLEDAWIKVCPPNYLLCMCRFYNKGKPVKNYLALCSNAENYNFE